MPKTAKVANIKFTGDGWYIAPSSELQEHLRLSRDRGKNVAILTKRLRKRKDRSEPERHMLDATG